MSYSLISNFKDVRKQVFKKTDEVSLFYVSIRGTLLFSSPLLEALTRFYMGLGLVLSLVLYSNNGEDIGEYVREAIGVYAIETVRFPFLSHS